MFPPEQTSNTRTDKRNILAVAVVWFFGVMIFLPSVTFSLLSAEIFPWAILFVIFLGRRIDKGLFIACIYLACMTFIALAVLVEPNFGESVRSLAAYLNCLLIFGVLVVASRSDIDRFSRIGAGLFVFLVVLGLLQISGLLAPFDSALKLLVPRASSTSLTFMGGRGATLLSSEPARAGIELVSIYLIFRVTVFREKKHLHPHLHLIADAMLGLFLLLVIRSAQCVMFYTVFIAIFYNTKVFKLLPVLALSLFVAAKAGTLDGRVFLLFQDVVKQGSLDDAIFLISNTSGHRVTSIIASYGYGITHPLGGGIGNWMASSVVALEQSGISLEALNYFRLYGAGFAVPIRSSGYVTNLILDVGILGIIPVVYFMYRALARIKAFSGAAVPITVLFILKISFFGSVGNPVAWIATAVCLRKLAVRQGAEACRELDQRLVTV